MKCIFLHLFFLISNFYFIYSLTECLSWNLLQLRFIAQATEEQALIIYVMFILFTHIVVIYQCIIIVCCTLTKCNF